MAEPEKRPSDADARLPLGVRQWPAWAGIGLAWLAARLPWTLQRPLGRGIGAVLFALMRNRRHVARRNIALCFPELDAARQDALARASFGELGIGETCVPGTRDGYSIESCRYRATAADVSNRGSSGDRGSVPVVEMENRRARNAGTTTTKPRRTSRVSRGLPGVLRRSRRPRVRGRAASIAGL